ncbi:SMP-30/gluconolactonase/LRE family protein [Kribbella catacumbae]|uniref:SMP-30/gluconolactonase/LRE family protein n=1 Tax=Kribbella catacumbae TaxID=460086 RepID=UPI0003720B58|nr:SMP-30/gluconolactonase/LRE family protein [Kribbella catacumbae]
MKPTIVTTAVTALLVGVSLLPGTTANAAPRPDTYSLPGDVGGSRFEGIGYDQRRDLFYVSETTGGEIHRGDVRGGAATQWLAGDGTDGRWTARGVTVDRHGRVYVAGGPNGIDHPGAPDLWVYDRTGELLAALRVGGSNVFLNDIAIGPDGAAYVTNSNAPHVYRVALGADGWGIDLWADATGTIAVQPGFNLGGIVAPADGRSLLVAQGNVGKLWRFDLRTRTTTQVDTGTADLVNADGLVLQGNHLWVVRNFSRSLTTLKLANDGASARLVDERATDPTRVFTTAKLAHGRLLLVDSKFDEPTPQAPYQVVALRPTR